MIFTDLLDNVDCVFEQLASEKRMKVSEKDIEMMWTATKRYDDGDTVTRRTVHWTPSPGYDVIRVDIVAVVRWVALARGYVDFRVERR